MKIRITGTKSECLAISNLFAEITENNKNIKSLKLIVYIQIEIQKMSTEYI